MAWKDIKSTQFWNKSLRRIIPWIIVWPFVEYKVSICAIHELVLCIFFWNVIRNSYSEILRKSQKLFLSENRIESLGNSIPNQSGSSKKIPQ